MMKLSPSQVALLLLLAERPVPSLCDDEDPEFTIYRSRTAWNAYVRRSEIGRLSKQECVSWDNNPVGTNWANSPVAIKDTEGDEVFLIEGGTTNTIDAEPPNSIVSDTSPYNEEFEPPNNSAYLECGNGGPDERVTMTFEPGITGWGSNFFRFDAVIDIVVGDDEFSFEVRPSPQTNPLDIDAFYGFSVTGGVITKLVFCNGFQSDNWYLDDTCLVEFIPPPPTIAPPPLPEFPSDSPTGEPSGRPTSVPTPFINLPDTDPEEPEPEPDTTPAPAPEDPEPEPQPQPEPGPAPVDGEMTGDPHIKSWNGEWFDYSGECDLKLVHVPKFDGEWNLDIHVRTTGRHDYSFISTAAVRIGNDTLEVTGWGDYAFNGVGNAALVANSQHAKKVGSLRRGTISTATMGGYPIFHTLTNKKTSLFDIILGKEENITIGIHKDIVGIKIHGATYEHFGNVMGLLGNFNGRMLARDGVTELHNDINAMGQEWQVRDDEPMLFSTVRAPQYPNKCILPAGDLTKMEARRLSEGITEEAAKIACAQYLKQKDAHAFDNCVYDVIATNDLDQAQNVVF